MITSTIDRLYATLTDTPGDDATRLVYADALEDSGHDDELAAAHRAIAHMNLGLCERLGEEGFQYLDTTQESDIIDAFLGWDEDADREDVEITEGFDGDLCVPFYRVSSRSNGTGDVYVTCTSRGDLTLSELRRAIKETIRT